MTPSSEIALDQEDERQRDPVGEAGRQRQAGEAHRALSALADALRGLPRDRDYSHVTVDLGVSDAGLAFLIGAGAARKVSLYRYSDRDEAIDSASHIVGGVEFSAQGMSRRATAQESAQLDAIEDRKDDCLRSTTIEAVS